MTHLVNGDARVIDLMHSMEMYGMRDDWNSRHLDYQGLLADTGVEGHTAGATGIRNRTIRIGG